MARAEVAVEVRREAGADSGRRQEVGGDGYDHAEAMGVVDPHQGVLEALFLGDGVRLAEEVGAEEEQESPLKRFGTRTRGDGGCGRAQLRA
jgi:hypothetical protein